jgi:hypothetical protein
VGDFSPLVIEEVFLGGGGRTDDGWWCGASSVGAHLAGPELDRGRNTGGRNPVAGGGGAHARKKRREEETRSHAQRG